MKCKYCNEEMRKDVFTEWYTCECGHEEGISPYSREVEE